MKRKAKEVGEKWEKKRLIDVLQEYNKLTYTDLYKRSRLTSKGIFNDRLKELEQEGYVKREYESSEEGRGKVFIKLAEKALNPVEATLRRLELLGNPYSQFDVERGRELLSENVVESIMNISALRYGLSIGGKEEKFVNSIKREREHWNRLPENLKRFLNPPTPPTFNEYHLIRAIARYNFETRGSKLYIEETYGLFNPNLSPINLASLEEEEKLRKALKREKDNPRLYPTTGIVNEGNVKEEFEELRLWIRPLLESVRETRKRKEEEETGELEKAGGKEYVEEWMDRIIIEPDTLLGGLFEGEQEIYLNQDLTPAWLGYMIELRSREKKTKK